jgi:hypothetical protein
MKVIIVLIMASLGRFRAKKPTVQKEGGRKTSQKTREHTKEKGNFRKDWKSRRKKTQKHSRNPRIKGRRQAFGQT